MGARPGVNAAPCAADSDVRVPADAKTGKGRSVEPTSVREAALAVGDDAWHGVVAAALRPLGMDVVGAATADAAAAAGRRAFAVAFVAVGPDAAEAAAALARTRPELPVVVAGAGDAVEHVAGRLHAGARTALVRLAHHLAHDLNNPLGGLKLYVRLLERTLGNGNVPEAVELAGKVGRAVDQLADMVGDIRRYDRLPPEERSRTRLHALLDEALSPKRRTDGEP